MNFKRCLALNGAAIALVLVLQSESAQAADVTAPAADAPAATPPSDIAEGSDIIVTATKVNEIAPVTSSLQEKQPQGIVSRSLIENALPATADFNQIALITPSVSGFGGYNGIGFSESKAQIRGFQDGEYNVTYDGVPFADTNDPTHHSTTFFPSNTIETLVVDRGPGNASQLGQATFGGNINLFSRATRDEFGGQLKAAYGSFNSVLLRGLVNSGRLGGENGPELLVTGQYVKTDGRLTNEPYRNFNIFGKSQWNLAPAVRFTVLGTYNHNKFNQPDKDGSTLYQASLYGKDFGLNLDPTTPQFRSYNFTRKTTDFEIAHLEASVTSQLTLDNKAYTYYYDNETLSASDVTGATANKVTPVSGGTTVTGVPGYTKTNKYRVYGNIAKARLDLGIAALTAGVWHEWSNTYRQQRDVILGTGAPNYAEKSLKDPVTQVATPRDIKFDQNSHGIQTELFAEADIKPIEGLTITPGYKHVDYTRQIDAAYNQTTRYAQHLRSSYTADLPFFQANYAVNDQFSVYAEYARGFLAPPLSVLYVADPSLSTLSPERSTNYQGGFVYHGSRLSFDADVYRIDFTNKFVVDPTSTSSNTVYTNIGGARYSGVEGQVTYALTSQLAVFANASRNKAIDNSTHQQIAFAPKSTAAAGVIAHRGPIRISFIDKYSGPQNADGGSNAAYHIKGYNTAIAAASFDVGPLRIGAEVTDLFNATNIVNVGPNSKTLSTDIGRIVPTNYDQYYYQPGRQATIDLTYRF